MKQSITLITDKPLIKAGFLHGKAAKEVAEDVAKRGQACPWRLEEIGSARERVDHETTF